MFTGLVEEVGSVEKLERLDAAVRLTVRGPKVTSDAAPGDSIAVDGVCLTVVEAAGGVFTADVMQETLTRSRLGSYEVGSRVNLERALAAGSRMGGHIVQGHVDGVGELISRDSSEHWDVLRFTLPKQLARYVVEKGSIALNGTSLTVSAVGADYGEVSLIPTTLAETTFGTLAVGEPVNMEVDVVAKYVEKMVEGYH
nr:riboflavin synthase (alpha subunit) [Streptococcus thermophilus]